MYFFLQKTFEITLITMKTDLCVQYFFFLPFFVQSGTETYKYCLLNFAETELLKSKQAKISKIVGQS